MEHVGFIRLYKFYPQLDLNDNFRSYTNQKHLHLKEDWKDEIDEIAQFPKLKRKKILIVHSGTAELTIRYRVRKQLELVTTNFDQGILLLKSDDQQENKCFDQDRIRNESYNELRNYQ